VLRSLGIAVAIAVAIAWFAYGYISKPRYHGPANGTACSKLGGGCLSGEI
jgi:hypothetical protein